MTGRQRSHVDGVRDRVTSPTGLGFVAVAVLFVIASLTSAGFASLDNMSTVGLQAAFIGIVALGQFVVILGGGIDLSIPAVMTGAGIVLAKLCAGDSANAVWAVPLTLVLAMAIGALNGTGIAMFGGAPLVVTLAMNTLVIGVLISITGGAHAPSVPSAIVDASSGRIAGVPGGVIVWAVLLVIAASAARWTAFGRNLYALGSNPTVAVLSGARPYPVIVSTYVISALFAGIGGILLSGYVGDPYVGMGDPYLFTSVAAVAIGGASILGGSGNCIGTVAGALTLQIVTSLLPSLNLSPAALNVVYGIAIVLTVAFATRARSRRTRRDIPARPSKPEPSEAVSG
jgi:ribose transport system permease protein